jgi:hypothetical protein
VIGKVVGHQKVRVQIREVERPGTGRSGFFFPDYFKLRPEMTDSLNYEICEKIIIFIDFFVKLNVLKYYSLTFLAILIE